jgi:hypothetical protein
MNDDLSFIEYINKYTKITKQRSITGESSKRLSSILINNKLLIRENDFKLFSDDFTLIQIISKKLVDIYLKNQVLMNL